MPLTRDFRETVRDRAQRDPEFRRGLLEEALQAALEGEPEAAKILLRDYVNATVGFDTLARDSGIPKESLMRMLSEKGNPRLDSLARILEALRKSEDAEVRVSVG